MIKTLLFLMSFIISLVTFSSGGILHSFTFYAEGFDYPVTDRQMTVGYKQAFYVRNGSVYSFNSSALFSKSGNKFFPDKLMSGVKAVYAGEDHFFILKDDGSLYALGSNEYGQLGDGSLKYRMSPVLVMNEVLDVSAGSKYTLVVKKDYTLWGFGLNDRGQLGTGNTQNQPEPVKIMDDIIRVSCGIEHSLALKTNGELYGFGSNYFGELGQSNFVMKSTPVKIMSSVEYISAGASHSLALTFQGELYAFGSNFFGEFGTLEPDYSFQPLLVKKDIRAVSAALGGSLVLEKDGELYYQGRKGNSDFSTKYEKKITETALLMNSVSTISSFKGNLALAASTDNEIKILSLAQEESEAVKISNLADIVDLKGFGLNLPKLPVPQFEAKAAIPKISYLKTTINQLKQYFRKFYRVGTEKLIAITFDDGPSVYTERLLDALKAYDYRATFFVLGSTSKNYPAVLKKMTANNCEIASHSYNHEDYTTLSEDGVRNDLRLTDKIIFEASGTTPTLFRHPYGAYNNNTLRILGEESKMAVMWDIDTRDWAIRDTYYVKDYILNTASEGSIMLLHDIHSTSVEAIIAALPELRDRGFKLVTVSELLASKGREVEYGTVLFNVK